MWKAEGGTDTEKSARSAPHRQGRQQQQADSGDEVVATNCGEGKGKNTLIEAQHLFGEKNG